MESKSAYHLRHLLLDLIVVSLPVILPGLVVYLSILWARTLAPLGDVSSFRRWYMNGVIVDGRLVFSEMHFDLTRRRRAKSTPDCQIKELDLKSGVERPTNIDLSSRTMNVQSIGGKIYLSDDKALFKITGSGLEQIGPLPAPYPGRVQSRLFEYEGRISTINNSKPGVYHLHQLVDGKWIIGRRLRLPSPHQVVDTNPISLPLTPSSKLTLLNPIDSETVTYSVTQFRDQIAFLVATQDGCAAYRFGIPFDDREIASAADPENFLDESSGWRRLPMVTSPIRQVHLELDATGPLVFLNDASNPRGQVYRTDQIGTWAQLFGLPFMNAQRKVHVDSISGESYLLEESWASHWNMISVRRIEQDHVSNPYMTTEGNLDDYLHNRFLMWVGFLLAVISHYVGVAIVARWFRIGSKAREVEYDKLVATPAWAWKRLAATIVDLGLCLLLVMLFQPIVANVCGMNLSRAEREQVGSAFLIAEDLLQSSVDFSGNTQFGEITLNRLQLDLAEITRPVLKNPGYFALFLVCGAIAGVAKIAMESVTGISPGKRLFRLRLVSWTLQRPGFIHSLIRTAGGFIDYACLATPFPALFFMSMTSRVQRFGDFMADTVVVGQDSIGQSEHSTKADREESFTDHAATPNPVTSK